MHQLLFVSCFGLLCKYSCSRAHGVVVSHPLSMREALGSIPSVSKLFEMYVFLKAHKMKTKTTKTKTAKTTTKTMRQHKQHTHNFVEFLQPFTPCAMSKGVLASRILQPLPPLVCTHGGTRTRNLLLRREAPYPLGHTGDGHRSNLCLFCCIRIHFQH